MPKTITVRQLKKNYPKPRVATGYAEHGYCVGGAFCLATGLCVRFPASQVLARQVIDVLWWNREQPSFDALWIMAKNVTKLNDERRFDEAWKVLDRMLNFKPEKLIWSL